VVYAILQNSNKNNNKELKVNEKKESSIKKVTKNRSVNLNRRLKALKAKLGDRVFIRIFKKENILEVWIKPKDSKEYKLLKTYDICSYSGKLGPKLKEGDHQAPEGFYKVYKHSLNPNSKYHLSFNLGYPNRYDKAHNRTGSYLMVHGECSSIGCYAMGNKNIEEIYTIVKKALYKGQKYVNVHIFPFRLSSKNLLKYKNHKWYKFWKNLKEGYDFFEQTKRVPIVDVKKNKYIIRGKLKRD